MQTMQVMHVVLLAFQNSIPRPICYPHGILFGICLILCYSIDELKDLDDHPEKLMKLIFDADLVGVLFNKNFVLQPVKTLYNHIGQKNKHGKRYGFLTNLILNLFFLNFLLNMFNNIVNKLQVNSSVKNREDQMIRIEEIASEFLEFFSSSPAILPEWRDKSDSVHLK